MQYGSDKVSFFLIDGYSVLGTLTQFDDSQEAMVEDVTVLGDTWVEQATTGMKTASIKQQGFYDDAANSANDAIVGSNGVSRVLMYGLEGNTVGKHFGGYAGAMQAKYERAASRGALHKANAEYQGNGIVEQGVILHALSAETTAGNTTATSVDNGALSSNGGSGYVEVTNLTLDGYTNLAVKVRHSTDNITFVDLVTFTAVTAAPAAQRTTVAGTVRRYLAASWAYTGTGTSPTGTFVVGFART